jgi:hypothetical protein
MVEVEHGARDHPVRDGTMVCKPVGPNDVRTDHGAYVTRFGA